jgi:LuxR family transcriptional regulator, maltose regulon positive regulatory protein
MLMSHDEDNGTSQFTSGSAALARGDWQEARDHFRTVLIEKETAEALEGLGMASWWLNDASTTFQSRERAFVLYRQIGDNQGAARMAVYLAYDYYSFKGEYAITNGWLQRAHRLLATLETAPEHGLLAIYEGALSLHLQNDNVTALRLGGEAVNIGRQVGSIDLEMLGLALEGLARVYGGDIENGMRCLDESTTAAMSGEMSDPDACASTTCFLIQACERVRDYNRAAQWCLYAQEIAMRWDHSLLFSVCRIQYAGVLLWRGEWAKAEEILTAAVNDLITTRPAEATNGLIWLANLRRIQGRFSEAENLLDKAEMHPFRSPGRNMAMLVRAAQALDYNDAKTAVDLAERYFRNLPSENKLDRAAPLELLALGQLGSGETDLAIRTSAHLRSLADEIKTEPLYASAAFIQGIIYASGGDHESARRSFEDAVDLYKHSGAPFETARVRVELAKTLVALKRIPAARMQASKARKTFQQLEAQMETRKVEAILKEIEANSQPPGLDLSVTNGLTRREVEVLSLLAAGKSNQEIASILFLSVRTVERHISNIYRKIGASGIVARASATAFAIEHNFHRRQTNY